MKFSFLTYNALFNNGYLQLGSIIEKYHPDIICLQEVDTSEENLKKLEAYNYKLADFANSFINSGRIFGVVTFYHPDKFTLTDSRSLSLPRTFFEFILTFFRFIKSGIRQRTVLETHLRHHNSYKSVSVYNTHLPVYSANGARIKALKEMFNFYQIKRSGILIITGDLNYLPYGRKRLEKLISSYGLKEATKDIAYTIKYSSKKNLKTYNFIGRLATKIFSLFFTDRLKIDYIFYKNLRLKETKRINVSFSDHYPIISTFEC